MKEVVSETQHTLKKGLFKKFLVNMFKKFEFKFKYLSSFMVDCVKRVFFFSNACILKLFSIYKLVVSLSIGV